jgi:hypothetical protein
MFKFILFLGILVYADMAYAGNETNEDILNKKITLSAKDIIIQNIINEISLSSGIIFSFEPSEIPLQTIIHLPSVEITIREALKAIERETGIAYSFRSNVIILKRASKAKTGNDKKENFTISGTLKDSVTGETLPYAGIGIYGETIGTLTNSYGFYSLTIPAGSYRLLFRYMGYEEFQTDIVLDSNRRVDVGLIIKSKAIREVTVTREHDNLRDVERRMSPVEIKSIQSIPSLFGEADVLRNIMLLPGVNTMAEAGGGVLVRGGNSDQNLILLDEATVYNAGHMMGTFSVFNPSTIKDIKLYKSGIPLSYGGRVSSVMDVTQKDGNMKKFHGNAGIGLLSSNAELEGPILKDKASFVLAARRSYLDLFFKFIPNKNLEDFRTYFYEINSKVNFIINPKNRLFISTYMGNDLTDTKNQDQEYGNITTTLRYNHIYSSKLFSNTSLVYSKYKMSIVDSSGGSSWKDKMGLEHYELKSSFSYYAQKHNIEFGVRCINYKFYPGEYESIKQNLLNSQFRLSTEHALESSAYLSDIYKLNSGIEIQYGARFSLFHFLGPASVYKYPEGQVRDPFDITDTIDYGRNDVIQSYANVEPRISLKFNLNPNNTVKVSYNKMAQYIQQVSNTVFPMPYDTWKPCNSYILPLVGHQFALGYYTSVKHSTIELSAEIYYKRLYNVLSVKPGTDIWLNKTLDAGLLQGKGKAYGIEVMANKIEGKLTGMVSYCWSRSLQKVDSDFPEERINSGSYYSADNDMPHKFTFSGEYRVSERFSWTCGFMFQSGRPISLPDGQYVYMGSYLPFYSGKNLDRLPAYHRLDIGAILRGKNKPWKKVHGTWTFSIYNLYARKNPYTTFIRRKSNSKDTEAVTMWAMGIVPSLSYSLKF